MASLVSCFVGLLVPLCIVYQYSVYMLHFISPYASYAYECYKITYSVSIFVQRRPSQMNKKKFDDGWNTNLTNSYIDGAILCAKINKVPLAELSYGRLHRRNGNVILTKFSSLDAQWSQGRKFHQNGGIAASLMVFASAGATVNIYCGLLIFNWKLILIFIFGNKLWF